MSVANWRQRELQIGAVRYNRKQLEWWGGSASSLYQHQHPGCDAAETFARGYHWGHLEKVYGIFVLIFTTAYTFLTVSK